MTTATALSEMLSTLFERRHFYRRERDERSITALCEMLLAHTTDVASLQTATAILNRYKELSRAEKTEFFEFLNTRLDINGIAIAALAKSYSENPTNAKYKELAALAEPARQELFRRLNQVPGATAELVRMRADLLDILKTSPALARTDHDFRHLLRSWFNRGFLVLQQINWETSASVLEKVIEYEAVHEIRTWEDLRSRLQPDDRRCYAFFHPAMPDEPLIFVEVALLNGVPDSIPQVLTDRRDVINENNANTAVFYSISNCQAGLAGISFGNSLIKQVARTLRGDLPNIKSFVTLSPMPGFSRWLNSLDGEQSLDDPKQLKRLAAYYLLEARQADGKPLDAVARFHLANGALVHAVHTGADASDKGVAQSRGVMVNYLYDLQRIPQNLRRYAEKDDINATHSVQALSRHAQKALNEAGKPGKMKLVRTDSK